MQVYLFFKLKNELLKNIALVSAFFHDIGKAGDCYYDMYNHDKYNKTGNLNHPLFCAKIISGQLEYILDCENISAINIKKILINIFNFTENDIKIISLISYMHWEFGKLNIPNESIEIKLEKYCTNFIEGFNLFFELTTQLNSLKEINDYLNQNNMINLIILLKLCILISCADISAGTNLRVLNKDNYDFDFDIEISSLKYLSKDPWTYFEMNTKYSNYSNQLIDFFTSKIKSNDIT